jgi:hypothetical protein
MKQTVTAGLILACLIMSACGKKPEQAATDAAAAGAAPAATNEQSASASAPVPAADPTEEQEERAKKQALMDYATMEDQYINDPHAQWAATGKASSEFGDDHGDPADSNKATNVAGAVDGKTWTNNKQDVGMDWLEATFAKPVSATEVRVVFPSGDGVEAVSKIELQDTQGTWNTVWSGLSDVKEDGRGNRTWFVKKFEKTAYQAKAVKITIANNVQRGYKVVDAVQLVGE